MEINVKNVNDIKRKMKTISQNYDHLYERMKKESLETQADWTGDSGQKMAELWNGWLSEIKDERDKAVAIYNLLDRIADIASDEEDNAQKIRDALNKWRG